MPYRKLEAYATFALCVFAFGNIHAEDSVTPYTAENVPQNVTDLWQDVDFRRDELATEASSRNGAKTESFVVM